MPIMIGGIAVKIVDGTAPKDGEAHAYGVRGNFIIRILKPHIVEKICALRFTDLFTDINVNPARENVGLYLGNNLGVGDHVVDIGIHKAKGQANFELSFLLEFDNLNWKESWSVTEYTHTFIYASLTSQFMRVVEESHPRQGLRVYFSVNNPEEVIGREITAKEYVLAELHEEVRILLSLKSRKDKSAIILFFDFPEEVRVPCEQYLIYFGKFLQDLGVQATSDLQHNAGQVLFTVTPADSQTALDKIRAALDVYLQLPSSPVSDSSHAEIAIQRLEANVLRIKSDLKLAAAELQAKNTTIEAQRFIIETQKGLLSGEIVFNSMKDVTPKAEDKEELLGGMVALTTYKDKGVEISLAEIYRKLRALFKDDE